MGSGFNTSKPHTVRLWLAVGEESLPGPSRGIVVVSIANTWEWTETRMLGPGKTRWRVAQGTDRIMAPDHATCIHDSAKRSCHTHFCSGTTRAEPQNWDYYFHMATHNVIMPHRIIRAQITLIALPMSGWLRRSWWALENSRYFIQCAWDIHSLTRLQWPGTPCPSASPKIMVTAMIQLWVFSSIWSRCELNRMYYSGHSGKYNGIQREDSAGYVHVSGWPVVHWNQSG